MLLNNFGLKFQILPANIIEYIPENIKNYSSFAKKLAYHKALEISFKKKGVVVGADTIVVVKGKVLGKPGNPAQAKKMLGLLSGKSHKVYTGISIINNLTNQAYSACEITKVKFRKLGRDEINFYVKNRRQQSRIFSRP